MLARTHGQPATPTTLGKELANFVAPLRSARPSTSPPSRSAASSTAPSATTTRTPSRIPNVDWVAITDASSNRSGSQLNALHDADRAARLDRRVLPGARALQHRADRPLPRLLGLHQLGYFRPQPVAGEVGSSTMPHKVNPIDFENAEGNLGLANALLRFLADKLPISRWQRDLTDSTVLRNVGVALGHALVALRRCCAGLGQARRRPGAIAADLDDHWEVLAEPIQTVMRRYGLATLTSSSRPSTRGRADRSRRPLREFIGELDDPERAEQARLLQLTPSSYTGSRPARARRLRARAAGAAPPHATVVTRPAFGCRIGALEPSLSMATNWTRGSSCRISRRGSARGAGKRDFRHSEQTCK